MARTDFYETLGVAQDIGGGDLKLAYRALALRYHPDRNPGDAAAEARFKEISEAFAVLRDPARRAAYDRHGHAAFGLATRGGPPGFGFSFDTDASCHVFTYGDEHRPTAGQPEPEARQPIEISSDAPHALAEGIIVPSRTLGADLKRTASACSDAPAAARSAPVSGGSDKPPVRKGGAPIPIGPAAGPPPPWVPDAAVKPLVDEVAIAAVGRSPAPAPLRPGSARARWSRGLRGLACFLGDAVRHPRRRGCCAAAPRPPGRPCGRARPDWRRIPPAPSRRFPVGLARGSCGCSDHRSAASRSPANRSRASTRRSDRTRHRFGFGATARPARHGTDQPPGGDRRSAVVPG